MDKQLWATFIADFPFLSNPHQYPWEFTNNIVNILKEKQLSLENDYVIKEGNAVHNTAIVEAGAVIKPPCIIGSNSFVGANAYLREGVFIGNNVKIGAGCEIKSSFILNNSAVAHFNYIGNSIIGHDVNFEAGSIAANHYNERENKEIWVLIGDNIIKTHTKKFGALVGDGSRIGTNAVLSPGTILQKKSIVKRLELIEQVNYH
ncbi:DapH/DapD/GlmU-related protein [Galbibacter sp. PAP.153]|uniref:DapH/DapD/GlmU-related protein n=1 Tax=Galbibacter sp. PAP.153 TaxID=3104623 RepID=UPI003008EE25